MTTAPMGGKTNGTCGHVHGESKARRPIAVANFRLRLSTVRRATFRWALDGTAKGIRLRSVGMQNLVAGARNQLNL